MTSTAATTPTSGVNAVRPSAYSPKTSATKLATMSATNRRSALSPKSDRTAPIAIASGCSVGAR